MTPSPVVVRIGHRLGGSTGVVTLAAASPRYRKVCSSGTLDLRGNDCDSRDVAAAGPDAAPSWSGH